MEVNSSERILRLPQVKERTGISRASIYQYIHDGIFPKPIIIGARSVGWLESEITAWIELRISMSRKP